MANGRQIPLCSLTSRRKHWSEDEAREILDKLAASGETVAAFARRRGLWPGRLWSWKKRLAQGSPAETVSPAAPEAPPFVPLVVRPAGREVLATVELGGGVHLERA
jgi:transposase-like protein